MTSIHTSRTNWQQYTLVVQKENRHTAELKGPDGKDPLGIFQMSLRRCIFRMDKILFLIDNSIINWYESYQSTGLQKGQTASTLKQFLGHEWDGFFSGVDNSFFRLEYDIFPLVRVIEIDNLIVKAADNHLENLSVSNEMYFWNNISLFRPGSRGVVHPYRSDTTLFRVVSDQSC